MPCPQAPGVYYGVLNFDPNIDDHIDSAQLFPYPSWPQSSASPTSPAPSLVPVSIALTEFHFILLYKDHIAGVCTLNGKQTYEDIIPLVGNCFMKLFDDLSSLETKRSSARACCRSSPQDILDVYRSIYLRIIGQK